MLWWRPLLLLSALVGSVLTVPLGVQADRPFEVLFHVARQDGEPVADDAFLDAQLNRATELFKPTGVSFRRAGKVPLKGPARLLFRKQRHALGQWVRPGVINVFVVGHLRDVDEPDRIRRGVHWRPRGYPEGTHLVILAAYAGNNVLAHELGHFFGNRKHSDVPGNLMSYQSGEGPPFLDEAQQRTVREFARRFRESGELR